MLLVFADAGLPPEVVHVHEVAEFPNDGFDNCIGDPTQEFPVKEIVVIRNGAMQLPTPITPVEARFDV
jgi:hypothetical protein